MKENNDLADPAGPQQQELFDAPLSRLIGSWEVDVDEIEITAHVLATIGLKSDVTIEGTRPANTVQGEPPLSKLSGDPVEVVSPSTDETCQLLRDVLFELRGLRAEISALRSDVAELKSSRHGTVLRPSTARLFPFVPENMAHLSR